MTNGSGNFGLGEGFHAIPKGEYHLDPCPSPSLSASLAKVLVARSPAHAWYLHPRGGGGKVEPTEAMDRGTLLDSLLLGGDTEICPIPHDDYRTNAAKQLRDHAIAHGKLPIIASKLGAAQEKADAIRAELAKRGIVFDGLNQQTIVWTEQTAAGSIFCRGRLDHFKPEIATFYDLKCVEDASPRAVARKMVDFGHHIQHRAYTRGLEQILPQLAGRIRGIYVYVEPEPPFECTIAHPSGAMRALGEFDWTRAAEKWGVGVHTGIWEGYAAGEVEIEPQPYHLASMEAAVAGGSQGVSF